MPTCIQMIMYRHNIPLVPAEEIGYHLGLTVPPEDGHLFNRVRVADKPPVASGYGTDISSPDYEPNKAFRALNIPLRFSKKLATEIANEEALLSLLLDVETNDGDALLCFNHGVIRGQYEPHSGHVVVFDKIVNGQVRVVDASPRQPKWRSIELSVLFDAIQQHGDANSGGIWYFNRE
ncbi:MAG: hypothetical protein JWM81_654 [Candidatus Saccharibacteria bacterium]|nr:hypothetical protein [Candidatus Saccharibacteria bacterium]